MFYTILLRSLCVITFISGYNSGCFHLSVFALESRISIYALESQRFDFNFPV